MANTFTSRIYKPSSPEAIELLTAAAAKAGLPAAWGSDPDAHYILAHESNGKVGRPNYTVGKAVTAHPETWPGVWERLRRGEKWTTSTATGLGQLLSSNAAKYYPDGLAGIGDPMNEAVGFLRYIRDRYGSPAVARSVYGRQGTYVHAVTGKTMKKGFTEGY